MRKADYPRHWFYIREFWFFTSISMFVNDCPFFSVFVQCTITFFSPSLSGVASQTALKSFRVSIPKIRKPEDFHCTFGFTPPIVWLYSSGCEHSAFCLYTDKVLTHTMYVKRMLWTEVDDTIPSKDWWPLFFHEPSKAQRQCLYFQRKSFIAFRSFIHSCYQNSSCDP